VVKESTSKPKPWFQQPGWAAGIVVVSLLASYGIGSRSLDTGSWQQYFLCVGFLILAVNRIFHIIFHYWKGDR